MSGSSLRNPLTLDLTDPDEIEAFLALGGVPSAFLDPQFNSHVDWTSTPAVQHYEFARFRRVLVWRDDYRRLRAQIEVLVACKGSGGGT